VSSETSASTSTGRLRASDGDREATVAVLQREVGTGRLTLDEFAERAAAAYAARTVDELAALTHDLPRGVPTGRREQRFARVPALLGAALLLAVALLALAGVPAMALGGLSCH
jgi:hypothetical protein